MDSTAVDTAFRGNGLQGRMLEAAENLLDPDRFVYLMCTVHPDNSFSRNNMVRQGYRAVCRKEKYAAESGMSC